MSKPLAVITGASTGIGREISLLLAARGYNLLLIARRADKLAETAKAAEAIGAHATVLALDITRPGAADEALTHARRHGSVEVLVNNAGFGMYGAFAEADREMLLRMIDLNVRAL
ncbi:MAG TPA: SDR family NAD(P)-dependent oxidoreductase, partial [bacterium]|nr:SDR family NAD(P)-dependent oxidoreductase [bacterium]